MHYGIPGELSRQPQQSTAAPVIASVRDIHTEYAEQRLIDSIDTFQDWLGGECAFVERVTSEWESRRPERLAEALTPVVQHAALVATRRGDAQALLQAMQVILKRYIAAHADSIARHAGELAAEDEQQRRFA